MDQYIKLSSLEVDDRSEDAVLLEASNGTTSGELELYLKPEELKQLSVDLKEFPKQADDMVVFENGEEKSLSYYILLRFIVTNASGHCAIHIRMNNGDLPPNTEISEFYIMAEPSQINRLGNLLEKFSTKKYRAMEWDVSDGLLFDL